MPPGGARPPFRPRTRGRNGSNAADRAPSLNAPLPFPRHHDAPRRLAPGPALSPSTTRPPARGRSRRPRASHCSPITYSTRAPEAASRMTTHPYDSSRRGCASPRLRVAEAGAQAPALRRVVEAGEGRGAAAGREPPARDRAAEPVGEPRAQGRDPARPLDVQLGREARREPVARAADPAQGPEGGPATGEVRALAAAPAPLGPPRAALGPEPAALGARAAVPALPRPSWAPRGALRPAVPADGPERPR